MFIVNMASDIEWLLFTQYFVLYSEWHVWIALQIKNEKITKNIKILKSIT